MLHLRPSQEPVHPGRLLQDVLKSFGLPVSEAAARMGVGRASLYRVFGGKGHISAELACRFTRLTGGSPNFYLHMQDDFDLWQAQSRLKGELAKIQPLR